MFDDVDLFYELVEELFRRLMARPGVIEQARQAGQVFRFVSRKLLAQVTVDVRDTEPRLILGPSELPADITVTADAETLHHVWLGEKRLRDALFSGRVSVEGSLFKALALVDLFRQAEALYPEILRERGLLREKDEGR
ncbi:MAG TPA: SCP2 sterol-binding domain-containing protein [Caldilineae bacterium]|nr:SCP2 sterol-binding domain-containing protein [Caldilineae bacterium]